eukprot:14457093-Ditylum_brightwellii.AAC.1
MDANAIEEVVTTNQEQKYNNETCSTAGSSENINLPNTSKPNQNEEHITITLLNYINEEAK